MTSSEQHVVPFASPAAAQGSPFVEQPVAYDGILLAGFGGPEGQDDVIPVSYTHLTLPTILLV